MAGRIRDQGQKLGLHEQAERTLCQEAPVLPLLYARWDMLVKPWVRRYPVSPMGYWFWQDVIIVPH